MKFLDSLLVVSAAFCAAAATPEVSDVRSAQLSTREVTVSYELSGADAIVTADVLTNGVSIGAENLTGLTGAVNARAAVGSNTFSWRPDKFWPDHVFTNGEVRVRVRAWATNAPPDYLVVDLATGAASYYVSTNALPGGVDSDVYRTAKLLLRRIKAGTRFMMGSNGYEVGRQASRGEVAHLVSLSRDYWIGVFEVTQYQWYALKGTWPSTWKREDCRDTRPVETLNWTDIKGTGADWTSGTTFLAELRRRTGLDFDLPTEAQWEYACRAGTYTEYYDNTVNLYGTANVSSNLNTMARYKRNGGYKPDLSEWPTATKDTSGGTARVGSYQPNAWGLYDMLGNVYEWCNDWYGNYDLTVEVDPTGPATGIDGKHILRGGAWAAEAWGCRAANRHFEKISHRNFGFRLVLN